MVGYLIKVISDFPGEIKVIATTLSEVQPLRVRA